jgi:F-type H+-transporting ATPase subunit a
MFIGEKVGKEWTMDQAPQYAIDHVANSKKNIFEFEFLNSLSEKISSFFGLTSDSIFYIDLGITKHVFLLFFCINYCGNNFSYIDSSIYFSQEKYS